MDQFDGMVYNVIDGGLVLFSVFILLCLNMLFEVEGVLVMLRIEIDGYCGVWMFMVGVLLEICFVGDDVEELC